MNQEQHILAIKEMCRVAKEVRVYPLRSIGNNEESPHLAPVMGALIETNINVTLVPVNYEFQKGASKMSVAN